MGYPNKPASIARAINELNPEAEFIMEDGTDVDTIVWGTGTPNEDNEFVPTETVPANAEDETPFPDMFTVTVDVK